MMWFKCRCKIQREWGRSSELKRGDIVYVNFFHDESSICTWLIVRFLSVEFNNNVQFCHEGKSNKYCTSISNIVRNFANF